MSSIPGIEANRALHTEEHLSGGLSEDYPRTTNAPQRMMQAQPDDIHNCIRNYLHDRVKKKFPVLQLLLAWLDGGCALPAHHLNCNRLKSNWNKATGKMRVKQPDMPVILQKKSQAIF